jgi:hypothetical protein
MAVQTTDGRQQERKNAKFLSRPNRSGCKIHGVNGGFWCEKLTANLTETHNCFLSVTHTT